MKAAYYNEFDPKAAAWLRELIKRGLIAEESDYCAVTAMQYAPKRQKRSSKRARSA